MAKCARKAGFFSTAYGSLLQADFFKSPQAPIQGAKLQFEMGATNRAIEEVRSSLSLVQKISENGGGGGSGEVLHMNELKAKVSAAETTR